MSAAATPYAPVSARASLPPTGSATPALPAPTPATPELPPPSTFDVLPDLHKLLKRLLEASAPLTAATPIPTQLTADGPLEIQHVATAANDVRLKLQKARRAVVALPDIDRTCEDQEEEIMDLQIRIAQLRSSLKELSRPAMKAKAEDEDQSMLD